LDEDVHRIKNYLHRCWLIPSGSTPHRFVNFLFFISAQVTS